MYPMSLVKPIISLKSRNVKDHVLVLNAGRLWKSKDSVNPIKIVKPMKPNIQIRSINEAGPDSKWNLET